MYCFYLFSISLNSFKYHTYSFTQCNIQHSCECSNKNFLILNGKNVVDSSNELPLVVKSRILNLGKATPPFNTHFVKKLLGIEYPELSINPSLVGRILKEGYNNLHVPNTFDDIMKFG